MVVVACMLLLHLVLNSADAGLTFAPCALTFAPCILTFASCTCGVSLLWTGADTRADSPLTRGSITLCNLRWWCLHPPTRANSVLCTWATCTVWWSVVVVVVCGGQLYTSQVLVPLVSLYHQHIKPAYSSFYPLPSLPSHMHYTTLLNIYFHRPLITPFHQNLQSPSHQLFILSQNHCIICMQQR